MKINGKKLVEARLDAVSLVNQKIMENILAEEMNTRGWLMLRSIFIYLLKTVGV